MENTQEQRICKTCNKPFSITDGELEWLKEHKLLPFTHCSSCRRTRKKAKKMKEKAAKEAMKNGK